jgi:glycopeptide antibiotics resistance protein
MRTTALTAAFVAYLSVLLYLTLLAFPNAGPEPNCVPFRTMLSDLTGDGRGLVVNFCGNVVGLTPLGVFLPLLSRGRIGARGCLVAGLGLSLLIETTQFALGTRFADVDDLMLNTLGAGLGYTLFAWARDLGATRTPSPELRPLRPHLRPQVSREAVRKA